MSRPERIVQQPGAAVRAPQRTTPVFGTAQPPRGISGALRRAAYRLPEYRAGHWLLLIAADRVDVVERRARQRPGVAAAALGAVIALGALVARARR